MSVYLEMQIDEMADEMTALKAINQKLQLEKNALKEQLILSGVSNRRELLFAYEKQTQIYEYDEFDEWNTNKKIDQYLSE